MHTFKQRFVISAGLWLMLLAGAGGTAWAQSNPVPLINQPLVPDAVAPGGQSFTLTVNGTGFVPGSVVQWNGTALATTYVSSAELTAVVPASDIASAGTASITVASPQTGAISNVALFPTTVPTASLSFGASSIPIAGMPIGVVVADFNADGKLDLALGSQTSPGELYVLLGNGDGTFANPVTYGTGGQYPQWLAAADMNGDGKLDLVASSYNDGNDSSVAVLLGNGDGTFGAAASFGATFENQNLSIADLNGDGNLDVAVITGSGVDVFLGDGDGTLQSPTQVITASGVDGIAIGDFNRDDKLDLAVSVSGSTSISILLGNGDGSFQSPAEFTVGTYAGIASTADVNGDGNLDLIVSAFASGESVLLGNGDGTFQPYTEFATAADPGFQALGDFNADGKLDAAIPNTYSGSLTGSMLLGNGDGTFQSYFGFATGSEPYGIAAGDFNGDGRLDLATANFGDSTISILLQAGSVSFSPQSLTFSPQVIQTKSAPQMVTLTNQGSTALTISSIALSGTGATDFLEQNNCGSSVPPNGTCTITVAFAPKTQGAVSAMVVVNTPGGSPDFVVSGTGNESKLTPAWMNFGGVQVGQASAPQTATLTNVGKALLRIDMYEGIRLVGSGSKDFTATNNCGFMLKPGASCSITVTFTPKVQGTVSAQVQVNDNGTGQFAVYQYVTLAGTGTQ